MTQVDDKVGKSEGKILGNETVDNDLFSGMFIRQFCLKFCLFSSVKLIIFHVFFVVKLMTFLIW